MHLISWKSLFSDIHFLYSNYRSTDTSNTFNINEFNEMVSFEMQFVFAKMFIFRTVKSEKQENLSGNKYVWKTFKSLS